MTASSRLGLCLVGICGAGVLLFATAPGIGLSPDSAAYIGAARGLRAGLGLGSPAPNGGFRPLLFYAPFFPTLLAVIAVFGIDPLDAARYLNCALFGANIVLSGVIIGRGTESRWAAIVGSILLLLSVPMLKIHSMAWSEPTFILLSLLAVLWLSRYVERGGPGWVIAAATSVGLAALTRYAGLFLIPTGIGVVISMRRQQSLRETLRDCGTFALLSGLLSSVSFVRNWIVGGVLSGRPAAVHLVGTAQLERGLRTFGHWLWVDARPGAQAVAVLAMGAGALLIRAMVDAQPRGIRPTQFGMRSGRSSEVVRTALTMIIAYGLFLLIAMSFFDDILDIPLDDRILSPMFAWAMIAGVCGAYRVAANARRGGMVRALVVIAGLWFVTAQLSQGVPWAIEAHRHGQGYASAAWRGSEVLARLQALPLGTRIFSNGDDAIYLLTGRLADRLPERGSLMSAPDSDRYASELARMHAQLIESDGVIVYFSTIDWRPALVSATELQNSIGLRRLYAAADGAVYTVGERKQGLHSP
jgi:4-amino-4-deoxy-L-arabinose transferase-like glycosyltransferase